jgi:D-ribose pyranose/furanose isomerase RbsD
MNEQQNKIEMDYKHSLPSFIEKAKRVESFFVIQELEKSIKKYQLQTQIMKFSKKNIDLELHGAYTSVLSFLEKVERLTRYFKVKEISTSYEPRSNHMKLHLKVQLHLKAQLFKISSSSKRLFPNVFNSQEKHQNNNVKAIIGKYVLINNQWYKEGDSFNEAVIKKVARNYIVVNQENKNQRWELPYYEYSK